MTRITEQKNNCSFACGARLPFIDIFKAIAMVLVILGHINFANQSIKVWIYAFHMPLFFFATGFTISQNEERTVKHFWGTGWKYFQRLIFPYILWALIFAELSVSSFLKILYGSYSTISSSGALTSLWFLPVMLLAVVLFSFLSLIFKHRFRVFAKISFMAIFFLIGFLLPQIRMGYPWSLNVAFVATGFFLMGNITKPFVLRVYTICKAGKKRVAWIIFFVVVSIVGGCGTLLSRLNIPTNGYVLMGKGLYGNPILFSGIAVFGILAVLSLSMALELVDVRIIEKSLSYIGQNTLCIFAVQKPIISCFKKVLEIVNLSGIVALLITAIGTILISCLLNVIISKFFPVLLGKQELLPLQFLNNSKNTKKRIFSKS